MSHACIASYFSFSLKKVWKKDFVIMAVCFKRVSVGIVCCPSVGTPGESRL